MYKAVIVDLDGTAVSISSNGSEIDERTREIIKSAQQKGIKITCATGREWVLAKPVIDRLGLISSCIIEGGTRIVNPVTGKTLWEKYFDSGDPQRILDIFKKETPDALLMHSSDISHQPLGTISSLPDKLRFIYVLHLTQEIAVKMSNRINSSGNAIAHLTPAWYEKNLVDVHVTHREGTKEHAIKVWQRREKITKAETIGIGDSGNDIPIFQSAGLKIAMGNATIELKEFADYIAPSLDEDGFAFVLEKFVIE